MWALQRGFNAGIYRLKICKFVIPAQAGIHVTMIWFVCLLYCWFMLRWFIKLAIMKNIETPVDPRLRGDDGVLVILHD